MTAEGNQLNFFFSSIEGNETYESKFRQFYREHFQLHWGANLVSLVIIKLCWYLNINKIA